jgi:hypothetical protein
MLLAIDTNTKTIKGQTKGYMTGILYLAPADIVDGINVCPKAEQAGCKAGCLYTAGRGAFSNVQNARMNKTVMFRDNRPAFMMQLVSDIQALIRKANREGFIPVVRLNGTSDIVWEIIPVTFNGVVYNNIMEVFPDVQFYDYTKIANRRNLPKNYDLTFSYSGLATFAKDVALALKNGMRIAVVFDNIPDMFLDRVTINGDETDLRFLDEKNVIVALKAKGKAKKDTSGFVVRKKIPVLQAA